MNTFCPFQNFILEWNDWKKVNGPMYLQTPLQLQDFLLIVKWGLPYISHSPISSGETCNESR